MAGTSSDALGTMLGFADCAPHRLISAGSTLYAFGDCGRRLMELMHYTAKN